MKPHILYGVLNWGLGHATRSKVIIDALLRQKFMVTLASDGEAYHWLRSEYPQLAVLQYPGYNIKYSRYGFNTAKIISQLPKIAWAARQEQKEVKRFVMQNPLTGIISDNRLGFWHPEVPSAYITHQVNIKAGFFSAFAGMAHRAYIKKFTQCWLPDDAAHRFAGQLSQAELPVPIKYLGPLSRYRRKKAREEGGYYLAVLSGPEPQRSLLQKRLLLQAAGLEEQFILVGGKAIKKSAALPGNVKHYGMLGSNDLLKLLSGAKLVISRSGYSSIMDYAALGKKALLIPTPGQGEQQYLAALHAEQGRFHAASQYHLRFPYDLEKALAMPGFGDEKQHRLPANLFSLFKGKRKG